MLDHRFFSFHVNHHRHFFQLKIHTSNDTPHKRIVILYHAPLHLYNLNIYHDIFPYIFYIIILLLSVSICGHENFQHNSSF